MHENLNIKPKGKGTYGHSFEKWHRQIDISIHETSLQIRKGQTISITAFMTKLYKCQS